MGKEKLFNGMTCVGGTVFALYLGVCLAGDAVERYVASPRHAEQHAALSQLERRRAELTRRLRTHYALEDLVRMAPDQYLLLHGEGRELRMQLDALEQRSAGLLQALDAEHEAPRYWPVKAREEYMPIAGLGFGLAFVGILRKALKKA